MGERLHIPFSQTMELYDHVFEHTRTNTKLKSDSKLLSQFATFPPNGRFFPRQTLRCFYSNFLT